MPSLKTKIEGIVLQERDLTLLRILFESRAMTAAHIAAIWFAGHSEPVKKRQQKLKTAVLIRKKERHSFEPGVLFLASKGLKMFQESGFPPVELPAQWLAREND